MMSWDDGPTERPSRALPRGGVETPKRLEQHEVDQLSCCAYLMDAVEGLPDGRSLTIRRTLEGKIAVEGPWHLARHLDLAVRLGARAK